MTRTERVDEHDLVRENRRLQAALDALLDELNASNATDVDTARVRELLPADREITPPWERAGHETKQAWLDERGRD